MTEKNFFIGVLTGKIKDKQSFEYVQEKYDYNVHGVYYRFVLTNSNGYIRKEVYDKDGKWRNTWCVMRCPSSK